VCRKTKRACRNQASQQSDHWGSRHVPERRPCCSRNDRLDAGDAINAIHEIDVEQADDPQSE
jgi:hypothetical protein